MNPLHGASATLSSNRKRQRMEKYFCTLASLRLLNVVMDGIAKNTENDESRVEG